MQRKAHRRRGAQGHAGVLEARELGKLGGRVPVGTGKRAGGKALPGKAMNCVKTWTAQACAGVRAGTGTDAGAEAKEAAVALAAAEEVEEEVEDEGEDGGAEEGPEAAALASSTRRLYRAIAR